MKIKWTLCLALSFFTLLTKAQIPNDDCSDAILIDVLPEDIRLNVTGNMLFSTPSYYGNMGCGHPTYHDLWYKFVAPSDEVIFTKSPYISLNIYENNCIDRVSSGCVVNNINTIPNNTYYIRVVSHESGLSLFNFSVYYEEDLEVLPEDTCSNAILIAIAEGSNTGDTVSIAYENLSISSDVYCNSTSTLDAWYRFIAPSSGSIEFDLLSGQLSHFSVFEDDCNSISEVACFGSASHPYVFNLTPGIQYLLKVNPSTNFPVLTYTVKEGPDPFLNIDCNSSELLDFSNDGDDTISVNLLYALNLQEPICLSNNQYKRSAWYQLTAPASGAIKLESLNGNLFKYSVYEESCNSLTSLICNISLSSSIKYINNLIPGQNYKLRIELRLANQDEVLISVTEIDPIGNDDCNSATEILIQSGSTCATSYTIDSYGASQSSDISPCYSSASDKDLWYYFEAPSSGAVEFLDGLNSSNKNIYIGNCGTLTPLTCVSGSKLRGLDAGNTYYLQVSRSSGSITQMGCIIELANSPLVNDNCINNTSLTNGSNVSIDHSLNNLESGDDPSCSLNPHDQWFTFTTPSSGLSSLNFTSFENFHFVIYTGACGSLSEVLCQEVKNVGTYVLEDLTPNTDYSIQVFNLYNEGTNSVTMDYDEIVLEANNECLGAITLSGLNENCNDINIDFRNTTLSSVDVPTSINYTNPMIDLWYHINMEEYEDITIDNESNNGSTYLNDFYAVIYSYDCNNLTEIATTSKISSFSSIYGLIPYTDYYVRLITDDRLLGKFCVQYKKQNETDECSDATEIIVTEEVCLYSQTIKTTDATLSQEPAICISQYDTKDVWRHFTVPLSGSIYIECQTGTKVSLYTGNCGSLTEIFCESISHYSKKKVDNLLVGQTYYLRIISSITPSLCIYTIADIPIESQCSDAISLPISTDNNCNQTFSGSSENATPSNGVFCGENIVNAVFYSIQPEIDGYHTIKISNSAVEHNVAIYQDCVLAPALVCGSTEISYTLQNTKTYIVAVFPSDEGLSSSFDICAHPSLTSEIDNVGISVSNPQVKLDVNGGIKPAYSDKTIVGNIRWSGELEVYDGSDWQNLVGWDHQAKQQIDMNALRIKNLGSPNQDTHAANKEYVDDHKDADSNPNNEIQSITKAGNIINLSNGGGSITDENTTYSGVDFALSNQTCPAGQIIKSINVAGIITCGTDETSDADNDPTNEIDTWSTLAGIPAGFADDMDNVKDNDSDPTNEIDTWSTLAGIPAEFADDKDDVDDADNDPTNEIDTWTTLAGIPADFADDTDDVDDADNDPTNEKITSINMDNANQLNILENGITYTTDLSSLDNGWLVDGSDDLNYELGDVSLGTSSQNRFQHIHGGLEISKNSNSVNPHLMIEETQSGDGSRLNFVNSVENLNRWTLWGRVDDDTAADNVFNIYTNVYGNVASFTGEGYMGIRDSSPDAALDINGPTDGDALRVRRYGNTELQIKSDGAISIGAANANVPANVTYIDNRLGVDIDAPDYTLVAQGRISASWDQTQVDRLDIGHGGLNAFINSAGIGNLDFRHDNTTLMTLVDNGHLLVGTSTDNGSRLINTGSGAYLTTGGTWTNASSRTLKKNFKPVNTSDILTKLASINILSWNYKNSQEGLHIGPISEEFYEAFGTGNSDGKSIATVDADGIALAAIQALKIENDELKSLLKKLIERVKILENK